MKKPKLINRNRASKRRAEIALRKICRKWIALAEISLLRHAAGVLKAEDPLAGWKFDWSGFEKEMLSVLRDTFEDGAVVAADQIKRIGVSIDPSFDKEMRERAVDYAIQRGADLITHINDSVRQDVRLMLEDALASGESVDEFAAELAERYAFSDMRAERIARTEMAFADVEGNVAAYKEAGVELKQWITANDELVSDDCRVNAAAGPIPINSAFPSGAVNPPEHPNCRCDVIPVLK